ncbi:hypothetical protein [Kitasatospora sp. NPDC093806]|uniref:hypothetical protein n=1 Tax=Kitasatospora sp. NPDC093806 TaxID=3155075 RepID=UPI003435E9F0
MSGQYPGQFGPPPGGAPADGIPGSASYPAPPTVAFPPQFPGQLPVPVPARQPGPYGVLGRVLVVLAPLLSFGLLGMVPSLLLAVRRRRAYDVVGAVLYAAAFLAYVICMGIAGSYPKGDAPTADAVGTSMMILMWFTPPVHFLLMDRQVVWAAGRTVQPPAPVGPYAPQPGYGYPAAPVAPTPAQPYPAAQPYGVAPAQPYTPAAPYQAVPAPAPVAPVAPATPQPYPAAVAHPPVRSDGSPAGAAASTPAASTAGPATSDELRELGELLRRQAREDRR